MGAKHALALASGTAALHLALIEAGVGPGATVMVSDLTFVASLNPILYLGTKPILIGSERTSWNMDPSLLEEALHDCTNEGPLPAAVVLVHLYGQSADLGPIRALCDRYGVTLIEDAAEALEATYRLGGTDPVQPRRGGPDGRLLLQRQQDHHHVRRGDARLGR